MTLTELLGLASPLYSEVQQHLPPTCIPLPGAQWSEHKTEVSRTREARGAVGLPPALLPTQPHARLGW
jgi:hypothetical protein